jgi:hypothetical protein
VRRRNRLGDGLGLWDELKFGLGFRLRFGDLVGIIEVWMNRQLKINRGQGSSGDSLLTVLMSVNCLCSPDDKE